MNTLRRFYVSPEGVRGEVAVLGPEETHHLVRVVRLGVGAEVAVFDGQGREWQAVVENLSPEGAVLKVVRPLAPLAESPLSIALGVGLAKGEAMDGVIRQATEMGVKKILPFISSRSERVTLERATRRRAKWERLAQESLKSSQRSYLPEIAPVQDFAGVLAGPEEVKLLFWEEERGGGVSKYFSQTRPAGVRLLIGPEGGFSPEEVALVREKGYQTASLGPRRLKVETATLAALTLIQHAWGDLA
ncbi:MAG: RsmE family RNA methyltransferase [Thermodesulfobacteriota bacterium]